MALKIDYLDFVFPTAATNVENCQSMCVINSRLDLQIMWA